MPDRSPRTDAPPDLPVDPPFDPPAAAARAPLARSPALPWWVLPALLVTVAAAGCEDKSGVETVDDALAQDAGGFDTSTAGQDAGGSQDAGTADAGPVDAGPPTSSAKKIAELKFDVPKIWADPLEQYLADGHKETGHWNFRRAVHDLAVYQGRLYMGYGDADNNLGRVTPIACRYWADPASTKTVDEFLVDEEEIQRYRIIGDELWIAGVDATEDAWLGNVYYRTPKDPWVKHRTVPNGVHVHDVALWSGAHYAVGSGAEPDKWKQGNVWGHLWKSVDKGKTWEIATRHWNAEDGDARWVAMLPVKDKLYVFGYWITAKQSLSLPNGTWTGVGEPPSVDGLGGSHPLKAALITETWPLDDNSGVVMGRDFFKSPAANGAWLITGDDVTALTAFAGMTVLDVTRHPASGEVLVLTRDSDVPDMAYKDEIWNMKVWRTDDMKAFEKILDFPAGDRAVSIAYWQGALYFGSYGGQVWRASAAWK